VSDFKLEIRLCLDHFQTWFHVENPDSFRIKKVMSETLNKLVGVQIL